MSRESDFATVVLCFKRIRIRLKVDHFEVFRLTFDLQYYRKFGACSKPPCIVKHFIQEHNIVIRLRVEPRPQDQGRRENGTIALLATMPNKPRKHSIVTITVEV